MAKRQGQRRADDAENWEVVEDVVIARPLGTVVSVRFDASSAAKVRRGASALNLTLSEFVRRAALTAADAPDLLRDAREPGVPRHVILAGDWGSVTGNLIWRGYGAEALRVGEPTVGGVSRQSRIDPVLTGTGALVAR